MTIPTTVRREIRLAVKAALEGAGLIASLATPGDWETQPENMPSVQFRVTHTTKEPFSKGPQNYTTTVYVELETKAQGTSGEMAQDAIEALDAQVETALLTNHALVAMVQKFSIQTETTITAEGRVHFAATKSVYAAEVAEEFDPVLDAPDAVQPVAVDLDGIDLAYQP